jgi:hypothetical protein
MNWQHAPSRRSVRRSSESGSVLVFVAVSLAACLAFSVLAIDVGAIFVTRVQLQNAADAAALAGASALLNQGEAEATDRAITVAGENLALQDGLQPVVIAPGDVTFPTPARCRVVTHRTEATGDPLLTFFSPVIGVSNRVAQVTAVAEAEYYFVCGTDCVKPWSVPDRWNDLDNDGEYDYAEPYTDVNGNGQWNPGEPYTDQNGNGQFDPDEPYDPNTTGYMPPGDVGTHIILKQGSPHDVIVPSFFYAVCLPPLHSPDGPPVRGGNQYRWNIGNCNTSVVSIGDSLEVEPGNMQGPTRQGVNNLISQDPNAYWDNASNSVQGSDYGLSPRVIKIAFFDPRFTPKSGRNFVIVSKMGAFFVEGLGPHNSVVGVFMGLGTPGTPCDPGLPQLLTSLRLVE